MLVRWWTKRWACSTDRLRASLSNLDLRLEDRPAFLRSCSTIAGAACCNWTAALDRARRGRIIARVVAPVGFDRAGAAQHDGIGHRSSGPHGAFNVRLVDTLIVVGREPQVTLDAFARGRGESCPLPEHEEISAQRGWCLWARRSVFECQNLKATRRRHQRKYSQGELGEDISFYFRGPGGTPQPLRAQNLELFMQLAVRTMKRGMQFHLERHDVSEWFRAVIKDESLATEAADVEARDDLSPDESRARIREAIQRRYTTSAGRSS